jgi:hypothetical protein
MSRPTLSCSVDGPRRASESTSTPSAPPAPGGDRDPLWRRLLSPRTGVLLLVIAGITLISIYSFAPIRPQNGLVRDRELVFYLSGRTADGALPLVDFQHGWNAGGWWVGSVLYRIADGSPNVFTEFPLQYGWALSAPTSSPAALFPLLVIAPFVPFLWRRAAPETRLAACLSLATAIVAIRRHDPPRMAAVSTLFVFTGAMLADDVHRARAAVDEPRRRRGDPGLLVAAGCAWAGAVVFVAFEAESLLAGAALIAGAAAAVVASRRGDWLWASGGAVGVLLAIAVLGSAVAIRDRIRSTDPYTQIRTNAQAIAPEVDRCLGGDRRAVIATTQLTLYDLLGLENPTPYVQFHYDFARYAPDLVAEMQAGDVPALIQTEPLPEWMVEVSDELARSYVPCSQVSVSATGNNITIWVDAGRAPAGQRALQARPDGTLVPLA